MSDASLTGYWPPRGNESLRIRNVVLISILVAVVVSLPYLLLSRSRTGEAAETTVKASVSVLAFNSSQQILYDYVNQMDLDAISALADSHPSEPIPYEELVPPLPDPLPGWSWFPMGEQYTSNDTDASAMGMYMKGTLMAVEEISYSVISHRVGGYSYTWDPQAIEGIIGVDDGYPKDVTVQGHSGLEWRSSGENLGEVTDFQGDLDSFGALWIGLDTESPVPECGLLLLAASAMLIIPLRKLVPR